MANQSLITSSRSDVLPSATDWRVMLDMGAALLKSGLLPQHVKTPEAAVAIIQKGSELGIPPMYALSNIIVIQGKPTANAELMLALIYRDHGDGAIQFDESTPAICTVSYKRRTWPARKRHSFTIEEARSASLIKAGPWQQYPAAMLRARCISAIARMAFPDSIGGMYTAEELGATVNVTADGDVTVVPAPSSNPHGADTQTGEIADDSAKPATPSMLRALNDLKDQYDSISIDSPSIAIPDNLTRGAARELKARFESGIRELLAAQDDSAESVI